MSDRQSAESTTSAAPQSEADAFLSAGGGFFNSLTPSEQQVADAVNPQAAPPEASTPAQDAQPGQAVQDVFGQLNTQQAPPPAQVDGTQPQATPEPPVTQEPAAPSPEVLELRRQAELATAQAQAAQAQVNQFYAAQQQQMARAQQMQIEQQRQERINQAHAVARSMADAGNTEGGLAHIRQFEDQLRIQDQQALAAREANLRVQMTQQLHQAAAPQYAAYLVASNGLPQEFVQHLAAFDGHTQDRMLPMLKAQHLAYTQAEAKRTQETDQRLRELEAAQKGGGGAFNPSGNGGSAAPSVSQRPTDPQAAELWDYQNAPLLQR